MGSTHITNRGSDSSAHAMSVHAKWFRDIELPMVKEAKEEEFGYGFIGADTEPEEVERQLIENIRFTEYWCRQLGLEKKHHSLSARLSALFDELPEKCQRGITDDRSSLICEVVRARNRFAHGDFDAPRLPHQRMLVLSIKLAALILLSETLHEQGDLATADLSQRGSPYLCRMLDHSDKPQQNLPKKD